MTHQLLSLTSNPSKYFVNAKNYRLYRALLLPSLRLHYGCVLLVKHAVVIPELPEQRDNVHNSHRLHNLSQDHKVHNITIQIAKYQRFHGAISLAQTYKDSPHATLSCSIFVKRTVINAHRVFQPQLRYRSRRWLHCARFRSVPPPHRTYN